MTRTLKLCLALSLSVMALSSGVRAAGPAVIIVAETTDVSMFEGEPTPFSVSVYDQDDNPVPHPAVQWRGPASGPRATFTPFQNGGEEEGMAWVALTGIGGLGTYQITASIEGGPSLTITVTNYAKPLRIISGSHQTAVTNTVFTEPLIVQAVTIDGHPISGATVTFALPASPGAATLSPASAVTGPDGFASTTLTAGSLSGSFNVVVSAPGVDYSTPQQAAFGITSVPARSVTVYEGSGQELPIGGGTRVLKARVAGTNGAPLKYAAVTFASPETGPGVGRFGCWFECPFLVPNGARAFTDDQGEAVAVVAANGEAGSYVVTATAEGATSAASFSLTNAARRAATILPNGEPAENLHGEQAALGGRFERIRLRVIDADGAGLPGAIVTLTPPASGPSLSLDQSVLFTDSDGWAETGGTANLIAGNYNLVAETPGVDATGMFMQNAPQGYVVGDQLADLSAFDHTGVRRSLRSFTNGSSYLLLDVCTVWCRFCQSIQGFGQTMKADLAGMGIPIAVVPMLIDSNLQNQPSTQSDAATWFTRFRISDVVLHAAGDAAAQIRQASPFLLGGHQGYPTFLLVAPDGTILARQTGGFSSSTELKNFVLSKMPSDISVAPASVLESSAIANVTVTRSSGAGAASVNYSTAPGSATTADFATRSGTLNFAPGQTTATIAVPIVNDTIDEPNELFTIALSNPVNARLAQAQAGITIVDNDAPSAISAADARFTEGTGTINTVALPVRLDRASAFGVTIDYAVVAGTAKASDVAITKGTLKFEPGQVERSIALSLAADKLIEGKETFTIHFSGPVNATLTTIDTLVTIVDDDSDTAPPVIDSHADVIVEVKMSSTASVVVDYKLPEAIDKRDGTLLVSCIAPSGAKHGYGTETVVCTAEDKAGNLAVTKFSLIVRTPTVAGAIFDPERPTVTLAERRRGDDVLVHVNAGAFARRADVTLTLIDANGKRHCLGSERAARDGSLDAVVTVPHGAALGLGQVLAESDGISGEYDRAWFLTVTRKAGHKGRHKNRD